MSSTEELTSIKPPENPSRRLFLTATTAVVGAIGVGAAAWPFFASWRPSARARVVGAPVEVNIAGLESGQMARVVWRGQTIGVMRRTPQMLQNLSGLRDALRDWDSSNSEQQPDYAQNEHRSLRPELLVVNIHCTHLGCVPQFLPEVGPQPFDENWVGGFFCPCHQSRFDLAGRVFRGVPATQNLVIPPYSFIDDNTIVVGVDPEEGVV